MRVTACFSDLVQKAIKVYGISAFEAPNLK
jgi:hypothetical protein